MDRAPKFYILYIKNIKFGAAVRGAWEVRMFPMFALTKGQRNGAFGKMHIRHMRYVHFAARARGRRAFPDIPEPDVPHVQNVHFRKCANERAKGIGSQRRERAGAAFGIGRGV